MGSDGPKIVKSLFWKGCLQAVQEGRVRAQGGVSLLERVLLKSKESKMAGERLAKSFF